MVLLLEKEDRHLKVGKSAHRMMACNARIYGVSVGELYTYGAAVLLVGSEYMVSDAPLVEEIEDRERPQVAPADMRGRFDQVRYRWIRAAIDGDRLERFGGMIDDKEVY